MKGVKHPNHDPEFKSCWHLEEVFWKSLKDKALLLLFKRKSQDRWHEEMSHVRISEQKDANSYRPGLRCTVL